MINIISKKALSLSGGGEAVFTQGRTTGDGRVSHSAGTLVYGKRIDGVDVTVSASGGGGSTER